MSKKSPVLKLDNIVKTYEQGGQSLSILKKVSLTIYPGEIVGLVGVSGSGKSTLLQIAGLLDHPTSGEVTLDGLSVKGASDGDLTEWRNEKVGFIYQFHHLLPEFTALENVTLPQVIKGISKRDAEKKASDYLKMLSLEDRATHHPSALSGGEQQRVAVARALVNDPKIILADEPTGNLDPGTAKKVFDLFMKVARSKKVACVVATHDREMAKKMDRVFEIHGASLKEL